MINSIKSRLYQEKLTIADSKETFTVYIFNSLLIYDAETPLPSRTSDQTLFDDFVHFFHNKVQRNRHGLIKFNSNDHTASPDLKGPDTERNGQGQQEVSQQDLFT